MDPTSQGPRDREDPLDPVQDRLDALLDGYTPDLAADPISLVHTAPPREREIVGLLSALLAFGQIVTVKASVRRALDALGPSPTATITREPREALEERLRGFVHRVYRGPHLATMLARAGAMRRNHGSLGHAFAGHLAEGRGLQEGLARFADDLRGPGAARGLKHLVPDPRAGSACKRLMLYLRWMIRPADGVDLGLWAGLPGVDPALLLVPVDTHVHRIARNLGLTARPVASWRTAEEITDALRRFDPADPVKYDFALCHLGVSRQCPSRRDPERCDRCVLRAACLHWSEGA